MESDLIEIYIFPVASKIYIMMLYILMMKALNNSPYSLR